MISDFVFPSYAHTVMLLMIFIYEKKKEKWNFLTSKNKKILFLFCFSSFFSFLSKPNDFFSFSSLPKIIFLLWSIIIDDLLYVVY